MTRRKTSDVKVDDALELKTDVGKYQPIYYAGASGDFNLIHIDKEFGAMVGLGGAILQGLCTMAFTVRMNTDWAQDPGALKRIKVRFAKPVFPEDTVTVKGAVTAVEGNKVSVSFEAANQDGTVVITRAFSELELD